MSNFITISLQEFHNKLLLQ